MEAEPMEVEEIPLSNTPNDGTMTQSPFAHVNTGVYSGHPGLQAFLTLGVPVNASLAEIKAAYRKLARAYHPDRLKRVSLQEQEEANERFAQISAAYNLLTHAYSEYDGKGAGENYPVFFGTPGSLDRHRPKERDPYELFRNNNANGVSDLPAKAPEHCIIPGDSSSLFKAWSETEKPPLCLPYEAQPPPLPQVDPMAVEDDAAPRMKRDMDEDFDMMPRQKRRRMDEPSFGDGTENNNNMFNGNNAFGTKREADQAGSFGNPATKKRRTV